MDNTRSETFHTKKAGRFALPGCERLSKRIEIGRLFTDGEAFLVYPVKCTYMVRNIDKGIGIDEGGLEVVCNRVMVTAPKRNHKRAVVRNLLKRRMKEAYRLHKQLLDVGSSVVVSEDHGDCFCVGLDIALSYVGKGEPLDYHHIEKSVIDILNRLCKISDPKKVFQSGVK